MEPSSSFSLGSRTSFSRGVVNFLMSHHITVPSVLAVKNSERVLLCIHMVL